MAQQSGSRAGVRAVLVALALIVMLLPSRADAQFGCCLVPRQGLPPECRDVTFQGGEEEFCPSRFNLTVMPPPASCKTGCLAITGTRPILPTEAQLDLQLSATSDGTPQPFFTSGDATTFALGLNAVKGTAQLYSATLFLAGFTFELPALEQPAGSLEVSINGMTSAFPLRVLDTSTLWVDVNGNGIFDGGEPTIRLRKGSVIMFVSVPFGGDGDPTVHDVQADGRLTLRGAFLIPVTPGLQPLRAILTTVDPDTGGPDDGHGIAPRVMVIDRAVEIRPRLVAIEVQRDPIKVHGGRTCRDGRKLRVSILTSATFDAQTVDPATIRLGDPRLGVTVPPPSGEKALRPGGGKDRNVQVEFALCDVINSAALDAGTTELELTAKTRDGFAIAGRDTVHVE
jgi:hypothetical protein